MRAVGALLLAAVIGGFSARARAQCQPAWLHGFGEPGARFSIVSSQITALMSYESPHGPALLAGGSFDSAGGVQAANLAYWTGDRWYPLATSMTPGSTIVSAFLIFDDGGGEALYVGGRFQSIDGVAANRIARWDGAAWSSLGSGMQGPQSVLVQDLAAFDDGSGPILVAIGLFAEAGGVPAVNIAQWNGDAWSAMGGGLPGAQFGANALAVHDDGSGPALFAAGSFQLAFGGVADMVARWNGVEWGPVGCGMQHSSGGGLVAELVVYDDGSGPALYASGLFSAAGCQPAQNVARWDGSEWGPVGAGIPDLSGALSLESLDDGSGPKLYAGTRTPQSAPSRVLRFGGSDWVSIGEMTYTLAYTVTTVSCLAVADLGAGPSLYAGGIFDLADGIAARGFAKRDGDRWLPLGKGIELRISTLAVVDASGGPTLFVGGSPMSSAPTSPRGIVRFDRGRWESLGGGLDGECNAIAGHDDGSGVKVAVGGQFGVAGGVAARNVALWNGQQWSALADGLQGGPVMALLPWTSGGQSALFAGGFFVRSGERDLDGLARWQNGEWTGVNGGVHRGTNVGTVYSLLVFDEHNGNEPGMYVGGYFDGAGQRSALNIARWDATGWTALDRGLNGQVRTLAVFDDGTGPALYAGGGFTQSGSRTMNRVAKWDGAEWQPVGTGTDGVVYRLQVHDDGSGPALYAIGNFQSAGGVPASYIARWDGEAWSALDGGLDDWSSDGGLASFDDGSGPALWVGGNFEAAGGVPSQSIAKWGCTEVCDPCDTNCDGAVDAFDIEPFIEILLNPGGMRCAPCAADTNADGAVDAFDIEPFVSCLAP